MNKIIAIGVATLAVAGIVGVGSLSASALNGQMNGSRSTESSARRGDGQGSGYQSSLESRAKILGIDASTLETKLKNQTMSQIAVERGMTEETFRAKMTEAAKARWEARGLSSAEITERMKQRENRHATNSADHAFGSGDGNHQGGYNRNR